MPETPLIGIVDDDPDIPAALGSFIRSLGYSAACFGSAEALLAAGKLHQFNCVISDIHMPNMSGIELIFELRKLRADLPIILMTGRFEQGLREEAFECGASAFITKPFSLDELLEAVEQIVGGWRCS